MRLNEITAPKEQYLAPVSEIEKISESDIILTSPPVDLIENETSPYIGLEELW